MGSAHRSPAKESRGPREHLSISQARSTRPTPRPRALLSSTWRSTDRPTSRRAPWCRSSVPGLAFGRDRTPSRASIRRRTAHGAEGRDALDKAMVFMADVATRSARHARDRRRASDHPRGEALPVERSPARQDQVYERLAPILGRRLPIGSEETIRQSGATTSWTTTRAGTPSNMTVIVGRRRPYAGGRPDQARRFGGPTVPRPAPRDAWSRPPQGPEPSW